MGGVRGAGRGKEERLTLIPSAATTSSKGRAKGLFCGEGKGGGRRKGVKMIRQGCTIGALQHH